LRCFAPFLLSKGFIMTFYDPEHRPITAAQSGFQRRYTPADQMLSALNNALVTLTLGASRPVGRYPASDLAPDSPSFDVAHSVGLMRVNHAGEVSAQGLYQGQALTAKLPGVRNQLAQAAEEEEQHLAWCETRLAELGAKPSVTAPVWYGLSFGLGLAAGAISDKVSLGFVAATEELVGEHLDKHLQRLAPEDLRSRAIVALPRSKRSCADWQVL
jgi:3-demethoxyubiquinol 3-hydroxylase